ncbi:MAG: KpsF/GutQ family sugar-phosphate isomerase [Selenomonas sp.]|nr:KpsF/GutQ family sugar-phosphate isomerase [Selenomonas sp. AE3005]MBQ1460538.1 KpsF/GutQ family sugar-phosphate isomerase [Selenomonas sp.]MBQ1919445.1 KpsF/GutQ family sugar-phosphate isomerase [Selenomonas sp.]MBQ5420242.1 KpsF/GutQ family sugar-phosphate isomerase [Selenomonas sp.]MBQ5503192.1 KpsF/GutQ family sugar-phosphate isomerase [Selenomonas sp.]
MTGGISVIAKIKEAALETLSIEVAAVEKLKSRVDDEFVAAVQCILDCKARVVVTGMGKSGHIGRKMAATFASTGTPAFFMHPGEAFHGDLGMVTENDVVIAISNSGESTEVVNILPIIHRIGAKIIAMCGRRDSQLGKAADHFVDIGVEREACPLGLAPTASTTATLAMGDALAIALMSVRDFTSQDFALFHPGGALGRKLLLTVKNVMHTGDENPIVHKDKTAKDALFTMTDKGLGAASVVDDSGKLVGIITDGIIRRALAKDYKFLDEAVGNIMFGTPLTITQEAMASSALSVMEKHKPRPVTVLPVIDENKIPVGIIHLTDLLRQGVV